MVLVHFEDKCAEEKKPTYETYVLSRTINYCLISLSSFASNLKNQYLSTKISI